MLQVIAETRIFERQAGELLTVEEKAELITFLAGCPQAGDVMPGLAGVRKLRWAAKGKGRRGGTRIIYYFLDDTIPLYLLMAYGKNQQADLTADQRVAFEAFALRIKRARRES